MLGKIKKAYQAIWKLNMIEEEVQHIRFLQERENMLKEYYIPLLNTERYKDYANELKALLRVMDVDGGRYTRLGQHNDGGYIMLDDFRECSIAYSIGICNDVSWDDEFVKMTGADIYMYDHTIDSLPYEHSKFHWKKTGLGMNDEQDKGLKTLKTLLEENGHSDEKGMILKIDIEGCEWDVLSNMPDGIMDRFDQIVMEIHNAGDINNREKIIKSLKMLNKTHQLIYVHANNNEIVLPLGDWNLPMALEVCYVRKEKYKLVESKRFFPTELDEPNNPSLPDIPLGFWC